MALGRKAEKWKGANGTEQEKPGKSGQARAEDGERGGAGQNLEKGKNATETQKKICTVYGEGAVTDRTCQKWFAKFRAGDFSLDHAPRLGRPVEVDSSQIETLIENNQRYTTREIADILKVSKSSVENHLHQLGYVNRFGVWVPRTLSEKNLLDRISTCDSLLKRNENVPFLKQIVTGDEKWILYNNVEWKR